MKQHLNLFLIAFLSIFICSLASADNQSSSLYNKKNDFLPADKAFKFQIFSIKGLKELDIKFNIAPGYYLYKSKLNVSTDPVLDFDLIKANGKIKEDEFFIGSDISPIVEQTQKIIYVNDSEMAVINESDYQIKAVEKNVILPKKVEKIDYKIDNFDKGKFKYFMHKEIHEQHLTIQNTLKGRSTANSVLLHGLSEYWEEIKTANRIYITACGTSWHAGLIGKNLIERFAEIPVHVEYASEFRYNHSIMDNKTIVIAISQSGETADTLAAISKANDFGAITIGICNVPGSSVSRNTNCGIHTRCGHEIGVASTKAFTSQIAILYLFALKLADSRKRMTKKAMRKHLDMFSHTPLKYIMLFLKKEKLIKKIAAK